MEYKIRTWNMNYWRKRKGDNKKTDDEIFKWIEYSKESILKNNDIDFFLLQETSFNMFNGENINFEFIDNDNFITTSYNYNDLKKRIYYNTNPKKYLSWGNMIISKDESNGRHGLLATKKFNNILSYQCYQMIHNNPIFFINVHLQKDFKTKRYYPSLQKVINEIKLIFNDPSTQNSPILLVGDFNASDKFPSVELGNFKKAFIEIKEMGFVDCTEKIELDKRSTMVDYEFQNDYVFVNKPFFKIIKNVVIRKDIVCDYIDHYPIDFEIEI